jgi:hypothetical protein
MTGSRPKASAFCVPENREKRQSRAVEHEHRAAQPVNPGAPVEGDDPGKQRDRQIASVADRRRRHHADQQVAGDTPGVARRK